MGEIGCAGEVDRNARGVKTYARSPHTELLNQSRRPGVADCGSWPSAPAEHPASLSAPPQSLHRKALCSWSPEVACPPPRSAHARFPSASATAPLIRVRFATEQHDVIAEVWWCCAKTCC